MANRYWVGGSADWDATAGTKWALTSGGAGGEAVPTTTDDVFFDANSGAVTVNLQSLPTVLSVDFTGFTGTFTDSSSGNGISFTGNLTFGSGMTVAGTWSITYVGTSGTSVLRSNGIAGLVGTLVINGVGGTLQLFDTLTKTATTGGGINLMNGTLDLNGQTAHVPALSTNNTNTRGIIFGGGILELTITTASNVVASNTTGLTLDASGGGTVKIIGSTTNRRTFIGGGASWPLVWFSNATANGILRITGSNTFSELRCDTPPQTIEFTDGTTQTVTTFDVNGTAGNLITLAGTSTGGWTISKSSGTVSVEYCTISYSTATGGATWEAFTADGNVDGGNNTGWLFSTSTGNFFLVM